MRKQKCEADGLGEGVPFLCVLVAEGVAEGEAVAVALGLLEGEGDGEAEGEAEDGVRAEAAEA